MHTNFYERMVSADTTFVSAHGSYGPDPNSFRILVDCASSRLDRPYKDRFRVISPPRVFGYRDLTSVVCEVSLPNVSLFTGQTERAVAAYHPAYDQGSDIRQPGFGGAIITEDHLIFALHTEQQVMFGASFSDHHKDAHPYPTHREDAALCLFGRELAAYVTPFDRTIDTIMLLRAFIE